MEEIKFVISELNKEPFNYSFNIVGYDSLSPEKRIEILFRVFKEIDPKVWLHLTLNLHLKCIGIVFDCR